MNDIVTNRLEDFDEKEQDYINQFLARAYEELSRRLPVSSSFIDSFTFDNIKATNTDSKEITVAFRIPSQEEAHIIASNAIHVPLLKSFHDSPKIMEYIKSQTHRMVDEEFYHTGEPESWESTCSANGRTLCFKAVRDSELKSDRDTTWMKFYMDLYEIGKDAKNPNKPEGDIPDVVFAINGCHWIIKTVPESSPQSLATL